MSARLCAGADVHRVVQEARKASRSSGVELHCPLESAVHPDVEDIQARSMGWAKAVGLVSGEKAERRARASKIAWLVARALPQGKKAWVQLAAEWTTLFCLLDDCLEKLDAAAVTACLTELAEVLRGGRAPSESPLHLACENLHARLASLADLGWLRRFCDSIEQLFAAFAREAEVRRTGEIPNLETYLPLREVTVGMYVEIAIGEMAYGIELSEAARRHPVVVELARQTANLIGWENDIFTWRKELEEGEMTNLVAVLAAAEGLSLGQAVSRAVAMHDEEMRSFLALAADLPTFGSPDDEALRRYVDMLRSWVRGHLDWAFETGRYDPRRDVARPAASNAAAPLSLTA